MKNLTDMKNYPVDEFRRFLPLIVTLVVWAGWVTVCGTTNPFSYIQDNWQISLTMVFGSLIAGATSEGGGAVAFPVFTKLLHIAPADAKVFSLAIQSIGMTAASLTILALRCKVDWFAIRWASLAGIPGIIISATFIAPMLPPPVIKISFTALVTSFAITLFLLNRGLKHRHEKTPTRETYARNMLLVAGFFGGMMSGLVGNGIDIITFSLLVLFFRVNEKVATPTSVILMAINSCVGFALHGFVIGGFSELVQSYWLAAVPVVVVGAPLGAYICSKMARETVAWALIFLICVEFITSVIIIPMTLPVISAGAGTMLVFSTLYLGMYKRTSHQPLTAQAAIG